MPQGNKKMNVPCGKCNAACAKDNYCMGTCYNWQQKTMGKSCMCYKADRCGQCAFGNTKRSVLDAIFSSSASNGTVAPAHSNCTEDASMSGNATQAPRMKRNVLERIYNFTAEAIKNTTRALQESTKRLQDAIAESAKNNYHVEPLALDDEPLCANKTHQHAKQPAMNKTMVKRDIYLTVDDESEYGVAKNLSKRSVPAYETPLPVPAHGHVASPPKSLKPINLSADKQAAFANKDGTAVNAKVDANFEPESKFIGQININNINGTIIFRSAPINGTLPLNGTAPANSTLPL
jgi:hypothetical protein